MSCKYHECYQNKWGDNPQCGAVAHWRGINAGNFTDGWTWCDDHVTAATQFREPIDYANTKHAHVGLLTVDRGETCTVCGKDMHDPIHSQPTSEGK